MKPDLQFSVLCDDVRREDNGKFMLIGLFEAVAGLQFPMTYGLLSVVNRWGNGQGNFSQVIRIMSSGNDKIVETEPTPIVLQETVGNVTAVSLFKNVVFPAPGRYFVEVLLDGDLKQRYPLMVLKLEQTGPGGPMPTA